MDLKHLATLLSNTMEASSYCEPECDSCEILCGLRTCRQALQINYLRSYMTIDYCVQIFGCMLISRRARQAAATPCNTTLISTAEQRHDDHMPNTKAPWKFGPALDPKTCAGFVLVYFRVSAKFSSSTVFHPANCNSEKRSDKRSDNKAGPVAFRLESGRGQGQGRSADPPSFSGFSEAQRQKRLACFTASQ